MRVCIVGVPWATRSETHQGEERLAEERPAEPLIEALTLYLLARLSVLRGGGGREQALRSRQRPCVPALAMRRR